MHPHHAAFFQFREVTSSLVKLPEAQQVLILKFELLHALERAHDFHGRVRARQGELANLKAETRLRTQEHQAACAQLNLELDDAARQLVRTRAESQQQIRAMRLEILSMENQCQALDEICRSLLLTIEQAACPELAQSVPTEPSGDARISA
jgi:hypothetical protein